MGPAATTTTHPPVPRRPIIGSRPGASRTPAAPGSAGQAYARSLTARAAHQRRAAIGKQGTPGPRESPRASPACPQPAENRDKRLHTGRLTRPRSFRDDIAARLQDVAGLLIWLFSLFRPCRCVFWRRWSAIIDERFAAADGDGMMARMLTQVPLPLLPRDAAEIAPGVGMVTGPWKAPPFPDCGNGILLSRYLRFQELIADLLRRPVPVRRVETLSLVAQFDVACNITHGLFASRIDCAIHELLLEGREERLGRRVVIAYAGSPERLAEPELIEQFRIVAGRIVGFRGQNARYNLQRGDGSSQPSLSHRLSAGCGNGRPSPTR